MYYCNYFDRQENDECYESDFEKCPIPACCPYYQQYLDDAPTSEYRNDFPRQSSPPGPPPKNAPKKAIGKGGIGPGGSSSKGNIKPQMPPGTGGSQGSQFMPPFGKGNLQIKAVDPGSIRPCIYRYVYIWPRRGNGFWAWLTNVGRKSASGYKWRGYRWVYFGIDLREIDSFECY